MVKLYLLFFILFFLSGINSLKSQPIRMFFENGVYKVPCLINGLSLSFTIDTGASNIIISLTEASFMLKNGYLTQKDLLGTEKYIVATGEIAEGTKIRLRTVKIGNYEINDIEATVMHNVDAPLLFGTNALQRLGKIEIDYGESLLLIRENSESIRELNDSQNYSHKHEHKEVSAKAELNILGWTWDYVPKPLVIDKAAGVIVFEVTIDEAGEVISIKTIERIASLESENLCRSEITKLSFSKLGSEVPKKSVGRIKFSWTGQ